MVEEIIYNLARSKWEHLNHHVRGMGCWCKPIQTELKDEGVPVGFRIVHRNYEVRDGRWHALHE